MKKSEIIEGFHKIHNLMNKVIELLPNFTESQNQIIKQLADNLTSINNKIIDALSSERKLEPPITEHFLDILKLNTQLSVRPSLGCEV